MLAMDVNDDAGSLNARVILLSLFIEPYLSELNPRAKPRYLANYWFTTVLDAILCVCRN